MRLFASLAAAAALLAGGSQAAEVLTFDDLSCSGGVCAIAQTYGDTALYDVAYRTFDYDTDATVGASLSLAEVFGALSKAAFAADGAWGEITVTAKGGALLTLQAADFDAIGGELLVEAFAEDGSYLAERAYGNGFVSVDFTEDYGAIQTTAFRVRFGPDAGAAIDNIAFDVAAVPEPAAWTMMIGGFGLVGFSLRRRGARVLSV